MGFLRLRLPWGFSHEARRGPQGASRAVPGNSCLHAHGEGELVITLESWETARSSRGVEEGLSRSFLGCGGKPSFTSTSAADLRELPTVPLRGEGCCVVGRASRDSAVSVHIPMEGNLFRQAVPQKKSHQDGKKDHKTGKQQKLFILFDHGRLLSGR